MHSLRGWSWVVIGGLVGSGWSAVIPAPIVTPAPEAGKDVWIKRQNLDAASFAQVLLTAIPLSLRQIAATNAPAVSSILWEEFLDDKRPQWFLDLPWDIQSYLIQEYGPETARPPTPPQSTDAQATPTDSEWRWPSATSQSRPSQASPSISASALSIRTQSSETELFSTPTTYIPSIVTFSTSASSESLVESSTVSDSSTASTSATSKSASSTSAAADRDSPPASNAGLTRQQKVGLGIGIPFGLLGVAALLLGCCFLLRRRRNKHVNGTEPPSSPGFIPRFAFQDKSTDHIEHRAPLNATYNRSSQDLGAMNWEDDGFDPFENTAYDPVHQDMTNRSNTFPPTQAAPMAMNDPQPIMAPALYHTHSSNRARGKRTSYSSLHSVAEVSEPDEDIESPILGRQTTPLHRKRRPSLPMVLEMPPAPRTASIKRKPVPESPIGIGPAAEAASQFLLRPAMTHVDHSGSSSSGLALSTKSSTGATGYHTDATSPISPISHHTPSNPFANDYSYVEDYGPEYQTGYIDHEDSLYGGNRSLDRYPDPSPPRRTSKTEWPLRNMSMGKRTRSPMWDRVYER